jgi:hypothetical protein
VVVIPQWHFSPQADTRTQNLKQPQFENQFSIFKQLERMPDRKTWIVEGCEGEIKKGFQPVFNGWSLSDVEKKLEQEGNIDLIMTHIGLKGEAVYQEQLKVQCGDNNKLVKEHLLVLSDIRGLIGYRLRIDQLQNSPTQRQAYLEALQKVLKVKATQDPQADEKETLKRLDNEIRESLKKYTSLINKRNLAFVQAIQKELSRNQKVAVVIGALHIDDLLQRLREAQISHVMFVPNGLDESGGDPLIALRKILKL